MTALLLGGGRGVAAVWGTMLAVWPPFATYQARAEREMPVFRLVRR